MITGISGISASVGIEGVEGDGSPPSSDTITIGKSTDSGGNVYLGYVSQDAADASGGQLQQIGNLSNDQFFTEPEPVEVFFAANLGQGIVYISVLSTDTDPNTRSTPNVGNFNAIIDGTTFLLTRQDNSGGGGIFQYTVSNPATGLPDFATSQIFYNFLDAREGQTVSYALELAP